MKQKHRSFVDNMMNKAAIKWKKSLINQMEEN